MRKSKFTEEQTIKVLREVESGAKFQSASSPTLLRLARPLFNATLAGVKTSPLV